MASRMREKSGTDSGLAAVTAVALAKCNQAWTLLWHPSIAEMAIGSPSFLLDAKAVSRFWMRGQTMFRDATRVEQRM